jgi:hypothetical protein
MAGNADSLEATDTEFRLLRTEHMVEAGMKHAAVVAGLMSSRFRLLLISNNRVFDCVSESRNAVATPIMTPPTMITS